MRGSCDPWSLSHLPDDAIPFHCRDLNANRASRESECRRDVLRREFPRLEQRHDSAAARIQKLLSQHFGHALPANRPISQRLTVSESVDSESTTPAMDLLLPSHPTATVRNGGTTHASRGRQLRDPNALPADLQLARPACILVDTQRSVCL